MKHLCKQFGHAVRRAREELGYSQETLAARAELNRCYVGEIERGIVVPSLATIAKIAGALNTQASTLLARCENIETSAQKISA
jgi:transcriptional regulator with XRE-family HTH domain